MRNSRFTIAATVAASAILGIGAAFAADLPLKAPPPPVPDVSWTGFYAGVNAGYNWSDRTAINTTATPTFISPLFLVGAGAEANALAAASTTNQNVRNNGFIGGGQIGYNYQFKSMWIAGIEADIDGLSGRGTGNAARFVNLAAPFPTESYAGNVTVSRALNWLGTVRGRFGFLAKPNLLLYATGGFAYGGISTSSSYSFQESLGAASLPPVLSTAGTSTIRTGWTAGAGGEWMFASNWSARLEWLHYDLGTVTDNATLNQINTVTVPGTATLYHTTLAQTFTRFGGDIVRVGIDYKFGPGPVVAKY